MFNLTAFVAVLSVYSILLIADKPSRSDFRLSARKNVCSDAKCTGDAIEVASLNDIKNL